MNADSNTESNLTATQRVISQSIHNYSHQFRTAHHRSSTNFKYKCVIIKQKRSNMTTQEMLNTIIAKYKDDNSLYAPYKCSTEMKAVPEYIISVAGRKVQVNADGIGINAVIGTVEQ